MNNFMRRTQSHKSNNHAGKQFGRLARSNAFWMIIIVLTILGVMKYG